MKKSLKEYIKPMNPKNIFNNPNNIVYRSLLGQIYGLLYNNPAGQVKNYLLDIITLLTKNIIDTFQTFYTKNR